MNMQAALFRKVHAPLTIELVEFEKPSGREVLVRTAATGVCHSDLHVADGQSRWPLDRSIVLGHEGASVVEAVEGLCQALEGACSSRMKSYPDFLPRSGGICAALSVSQGQVDMTLSYRILSGPKWRSRASPHLWLCIGMLNRI